MVMKRMKCPTGRLLLLIATAFGFSCGAQVPVSHLNCCPDGSCCIAIPKPRPDKVALVKSGELKRARASWWGFDRNDATECLQAAISSGVPELVVDFIGVPWIVRPLKGVSNQSIIFEHGVELVAKKGEYRGLTDIMLTYLNAENVKIFGEGATLRMHREDYAKAPYVKGEWRHLLCICGGRNVLIEGLRLADSGGDGVYVGMKGAGKIPKNITLRNLVLDRNWRNALSVIAVDGMLVENCSFLNTSGTLPEAGVDFEPNSPDERIVNCVLRNCVSDNNRGKAFGINATESNAQTAPYGIRFENCRASRSKWGWSYTDGGCNQKDGCRPWDGGTVEFVDSTFIECDMEGVAVYRKPLSTAKLILKNCLIADNCRKQRERPDVRLAVSGHHNLDPDVYHFENVTVKQSAERDWLATSDDGVALPGNVTCISGVVSVVSSDGSKRVVVLDEEWSRSRFKTSASDVDAIPPPRVAPDFSKMSVSDPEPGVFRAFGVFFLRNSNRCIFYAEKAGEVSFDAVQNTVGRRPPKKGWINVVPIGGKRSVCRMALPGTGDVQRISCTVPKKGFYTMRLSLGGNVIGFSGSSVPMALDTTSGCATMYRCDCTFHFNVPEGEKFWLHVKGDGRECVLSDVKTPAGDTFWRKIVDGDGFWCVSGKDSLPGMWSISLIPPPGRPYEDAEIELCGVSGFLFPDRYRNWK